MTSQEETLRHELVRIGKLMYQKGFIVATDGNISARLAADRILMTPSGQHKGFLATDDLIVVDMEGTVVTAARDLKPTSEMPMHLEVYHQRPEVNAVVHGHLPIAVALSIADISLQDPLLPETVVTLGQIPTTDYATPSSYENVLAIRDLIADHDALILRRHGVLTVGKTPFQAFIKMEKVEYTAQVAMMVALLGKGGPLLPDQVAKLIDLRKQFGLA